MSFSKGDFSIIQEQMTGLPQCRTNCEKKRAVPARDAKRSLSSCMKSLKTRDDPAREPALNSGLREQILDVLAQLQQVGGLLNDRVEAGAVFWSQIRVH